MSRSGIVNVRMVITEEKILSNIDKVQKLINPNSKKQIVELEENSYFKDLVESIKTYLIEYPKKKNFPVDVYKVAYGLVEFTTTQFEENTKKIEGLIKQREENITLSGELKEAIKAAENKEDGWKEKVNNLSGKIDEEIINNLNEVGKAKSNKTQKYADAIKLLNARANNLEANLHIEIDMERLEDSSKALSYIGIEISEALKLIPVPEEQLRAVENEDILEEAVESSEHIAEAVPELQLVEENDKAEVQENIQTIEEIKPLEEENNNELESILEGIIPDEAPEEKVIIDEAKQQYVEETTFEAKPSLWQRFKNSKFVRAATYVFRIKIRIELPSNALPEGRGDNV